LPYSFFVFNVSLTQDSSRPSGIILIGNYRISHAMAEMGLSRRLDAAFTGRSDGFYIWQRPAGGHLGNWFQGVGSLSRAPYWRGRMGTGIARKERSAASRKPRN
jgi:hypothetical protein